MLTLSRALHKFLTLPSDASPELAAAQALACRVLGPAGRQGAELVVLTGVRGWLKAYPTFMSLGGPSGSGSGGGGGGETSVTSVAQLWPTPAAPALGGARKKHGAASEAMLSAAFSPQGSAGGGIVFAALLSVLAAVRSRDARAPSSLRALLDRAGGKEERAVLPGAKAKPWSTEWPLLLCRVLERPPSSPSPFTSTAIARPPPALRREARRLLHALCWNGAEGGYGGGERRLRDVHLFTRLLRTAATAVAVAVAVATPPQQQRVRTQELPYARQLELFAALRTLLRLARRRSQSWRALTALPRLPFPAVSDGGEQQPQQQQQQQPQQQQQQQQQQQDDEAPIVTLFDMASALDGQGQLLCLRLLEIGTTEEGPDYEEDEEGREAGDRRMDRKENEEAALEEDEDEDETRELDEAQVVEASSWDASPETAALLVKAGRLAAPKVLAWVRDIVLGSPLAPARALASLLLRRCWMDLPTAERARVAAGFVRTLLPVLAREGARGEPAWALVSLMCEQGIAKGREAGPAAAAAAEATTALMRTLLRVLPAQLSAVTNHPTAPLYAAVRAAAKCDAPHDAPPRYCLEAEPCLGCCPGEQGEEPAACSAAGYRSLTLDSLKTGLRATETTLTCALAAPYWVRRVDLRVGDPHGRYVKAVEVFFHPRAVASATTLADLPVAGPRLHHAAGWQRLATLRLTPGQTSAAVDLPVPALVGALLINFLDFHHPSAAAAGGGGGGGRGAAAGGVSCPNCARAVVDANGVCRNCGEMVFSCRVSSVCLLSRFLVLARTCSHPPPISSNPPKSRPTPNPTGLPQHQLRAPRRLPLHELRLLQLRAVRLALHRQGRRARGAAGRGRRRGRPGAGGTGPRRGAQGVSARGGGHPRGAGRAAHGGPAPARPPSAGAAGQRRRRRRWRGGGGRGGGRWGRGRDAGGLHGRDGVPAGQRAVGGGAGLLGGAFGLACLFFLLKIIISLSYLRRT